MKHPLRSLFLLGIFLLLPIGSGFAAGKGEAGQWEWIGVARIVAIGDVHGAFDNMVAVLKNAGILDEKLKWKGGRPTWCRTVTSWTAVLTPERPWIF